MLHSFFHDETSTFTYLLADTESGTAILIDPVRDSAQHYLDYIQAHHLSLAVVLETHVHADHITAAAVLRDQTGCSIGYPKTANVEGADLYLEDRFVVEVGSIALETRLTPGHTIDSACYVDHANNRVFTGDTLLIDGCGRTDFQGGCAKTLFTSVHDNLFDLDGRTVVYPGHDYKGRTTSTIEWERDHNHRLGNRRPSAEFVQLMADLNLSYPKHIDRAVPANRRLGRIDESFSTPRS